MDKYDLIRLHSRDWSENDHFHICLAARLLEEDDFKAVCPAGENCTPELEDICDCCSMMRVIHFNSFNDRKSVTLDDEFDTIMFYKTVQDYGGEVRPAPPGEEGGIFVNGVRMTGKEIFRNAGFDFDEDNNVEPQHGKCAVCGKEGPVFVCSSLLGGISNAYCDDCLSSGAEPWGDLVSYISCAGCYPDDINDTYRNVVRATCDRLGKTEQEFADAVKQALREEINELSQEMTHYKERDTRDENEEVDFFSYTST